jgi:hypothetical protein
MSYGVNNSAYTLPPTTLTDAQPISTSYDYADQTTPMQQGLGDTVNGVVGKAALLDSYATHIPQVEEMAQDRLAGRMLAVKKEWDDEAHTAPGELSPDATRQALEVKGVPGAGESDFHNLSVFSP